MENLSNPNNGDAALKYVGGTDAAAVDPLIMGFADAGDATTSIKVRIDDKVGDSRPGSTLRVDCQARRTPALQCVRERSAHRIAG